MTTSYLNNQPNVNNSSVALAAQPSEMGVRGMSSLEIADITGKQHAHVMRDIRTLIEQGVNESNFGLVDYTDKKGEKRSMYNLTKKGCLILASGYNAVLREKIIDRWESLETGQATPMYQAIQQTVQPQQTTTDYSLEEKFKAIELSCKMLRKSAASKTRMVNSLIVPMGLPAFDYVETEGVFLSAKDCLDKYPVTYKRKKLSAVTFNQIMIKQGYLEEIPHPKGRTSLKLLTEKGLKWGKNESSTDHPNSITAHYDVKRFPELLKELGLK